MRHACQVRARASAIQARRLLQWAAAWPERIQLLAAHVEDRTDHESTWTEIHPAVDAANRLPKRRVRDNGISRPVRSFFARLPWLPRLLSPRS